MAVKTKFDRDVSVHRPLRVGDRGEDARKVWRATNRRLKEAGSRKRIVHARGKVTKKRLRKALDALELLGVRPKHRGFLTKRAQEILRDPDTRTAAQKRRAARRGHVHTPVERILSSSWGWHPPVHDGVDLICPPDEPLLAICDAEVIRADAGGWWGKGAPSDPAVRARGDGIIVLRCLVDDGPFRKGLRFCYGHAEGARVKVGQRVKAGEVIGRAGFANASHTHFMVHGRDDARGIGDRDPMPYVEYALRHS